MDRHMTWGDRQAELAREKNLKKLQKLAASAPAPEPSKAASTSQATKPAASKAAKPAKKTAAKKSTPTKAKKSSKK